ncbi:metallophosphoesterase [Polyangium fumosum]|uniref:NACHT domain-containing protein n=1 Tax=Polyangium fumosum TaxID=889272 RepID=A0A4U1JHV3_9BACT|nr:metallophosphoesterase [Polyangium fumosum]TKD12187.1 NACHT domain-containing protein [Polyangium fumosum]
MNLARPIFAERELRVVLFCEEEVTAALARGAPDFFDWIGKRVECGRGAPRHTIAGLRAGVCARAWSIGYRGNALGAAFEAAFPGRTFLRVSGELEDGELVATVRSAERAYLIWTNVGDTKNLQRIRSAVAAAGRRGRCIVDDAEVWGGEGLFPVSEAVMEPEEAARVLSAATAPARLAALLGLEPEAIKLAAEIMAKGVASAEIEAVVAAAGDPGAALARMAFEGEGVDVEAVAAMRAAAPVVRGFLGDGRVRGARERGRGRGGEGVRAALTLSGGEASVAKIIENTTPSHPAVSTAKANTSPKPWSIPVGGTQPDESRQLPSLREILGDSLDGYLELGDALRALLRAYTERNHIAYVENEGYYTSALDGVAPAGIPGLRDPVGFHVTGSRLDVTVYDKLIRRVLSNLGIQWDQQVHIVIIAPIDWSVENIKLRKASSSRIKVHLWGNHKIEQLMRECPAMFARYYPLAARALLPGYDGHDLKAFALKYRERVALVHGRLRTIGIPPETRRRDSPIELPLADLFIPLHLSETQVLGYCSIDYVLQHRNSVVVLGDPGMGKSTLLAYIALVFAGGARLEGFKPGSRDVPLYIPLRDFVRRQKVRPELTFLDYIELEARDRYELPNVHRAFFEATLRMGEAIMLFDGLDEVGTEAERHRISIKIRAFRDDFPRCRIWLTSRVYGYTENIRLSESKFEHYRIDPLDSDEINDFIERWYTIHIPDDANEREEQAASLRAAIHRTSSVRRLAGNPLLLTLMAFIHHGMRRLPKDRGELYEKCVEMLLKTWQEARRKDGEAHRALEGLTLHIPTQKDYLAHLAYYIQQKNQRGTDDNARGLISRREALDVLGVRHFARARRERPEMTEVEAHYEMAQFLEYISDQTGLLVDRGNDQLSFIHLSFQEYLAAWVFLTGTDVPRGPEFFVAHLGDPAWEEVLLLRLYIVLRGGGGGESEFDRIVASMLRALERKKLPEGWLTLVRAVRDDLEFTERDRKTILQQALSYWLERRDFGDTWYLALQDVRLFSPQACGMLRALIVEMQQSPQVATEQAIACLHLESRLFGFPAEAAARMRRRADVSWLLADLVPFMGDPGIDALLAETATLKDWARGLGRLAPTSDSAFVEWFLKGNSIPPTAFDAATAILWNTIVIEPPSIADVAWEDDDDDAEVLERQRLNTAYAWPEEEKSAPTSGPAAALFIAHAAYTSLMTGIDCTLPVPSDLADPRVRVSHLLYEIANFRDVESNARKLKHEIENASPELRPLLEIAGLLPSAANTPAATTITAPSKDNAPSQEKPRPLFTWLHLSDVHFGHPNVSHRWDQKLVLAALRDDLARLDDHGIPKPDALFLTGDIAFSGKKEQYAEARAWIDALTSRLGIAPDRVFLVPGNHDVDRAIDKTDRNVARLLRGLRQGADLLDEVLANADDKALLTSRFAAYLEFARAFPAVHLPDTFSWAHAFTTNGLALRILGLNTALIAADDLDRGKLWLGNEALAKTLADADRSRELVLVLTHHPLRDGWLGDQRDADRYLQSRAHVHLFGHVHDATSEDARSGSGTGLLRIAAGAAHGDNLPGIPASHGYSVGAVIPMLDGSVHARIWPRAWSEKNKDFRVDNQNTPHGRDFAEHLLPGVPPPTSPLTTL